MSDYGKFVDIELNTRKVSIRVFPIEDQIRFFGGGGLGAKIFFDEGDDDSIVVANGLLTGYSVPTACKTSFIFQSPLTGIFGESSVGGKFGATMKKADVDGLILHGASESPVVLVIENGFVAFHDATEIWGLDTFASHDRLKQELGQGAQIGVIGPAGEIGVRFASIMFEGEFPRAAGRTGIGAKFGQKKIKGIAARGEGRPEANDAEALKNFVRDLNRSIRERAQGLHKFGTAGGVQRREISGDLPIKNFAQGAWPEGAARITGQAYAAEMQKKHHACFMCPIACAKAIEIKQGEFAGLITSQPEYETVGALGSNLLNDSPEGVAVANMLCNRFGIDTISAGVVLGWLFECVERGLITEEQVALTDCRPIWGDNAAIRQLIEMMAHRQGIGDLLAEGVAIAAQRVGGGSERFAVHAKGLELPMHDPRGLVSSAATYATGNRGGAHGESLAYYLEEGMKIRDMGFPDQIDPHTPIGKGEMTAKMQNLSSTFDALGLCKFLLGGGVGPGDLVRFIELTFGWPFDIAKLLETGERIYTLKRLYNQRRGLDIEQDTLTPRILEDKRGDGLAGDVLPDLERMRSDLYQMRGWDKRGRVTAETARRLGLEEYLP